MSCLESVHAVKYASQREGVLARQIRRCGSHDAESCASQDKNTAKTSDLEAPRVGSKPPPIVPKPSVELFDRTNSLPAILPSLLHDVGLHVAPPAEPDTSPDRGGPNSQLSSVTPIES